MTRHHAMSAPDHPSRDADDAPRNAARVVRPRIVALVRAQVTGSTLQNAIAGRMVVEAVTTVRALSQRVRARGRPLRALIVEPVDADGVTAATVLPQLAAARPTLPMIGYCDPWNDESHSVVELVRAGVHEIIFRGIDDAGHALRRAIHSATHMSAAAQVLDGLRPHLTPDGSALVTFCIQQVRGGLTPRQMALGLGVSLRTLHRRCASSGLPLPSALITWVRLLLVVQLLIQSDESIEQIALGLDFPSAVALRNTFKRYTGMRPTEARDNGGLSPLLESFLAQRAGARPPRRR
ncbi:MAG TPA: helix-turn-helix domain-containing protein [Gemmatimonadaceae bacterium]|nr:helix-turn-helix domain-containing protein [Gemmatimonadaceae bacterium]